jgi:hypothetical protein
VSWRNNIKIAVKAKKMINLRKKKRKIAQLERSSETTKMQIWDKVSYSNFRKNLKI